MTDRVEFEEYVFEGTGDDAVDDVTNEIFESLEKLFEVDERTLAFDVCVPANAVVTCRKLDTSLV